MSMTGLGLAWGAVFFGGIVTSACIGGQQPVPATDPNDGRATEAPVGTQDSTPYEQAEPPTDVQGDVVETIDDPIGTQTESAFSEPYTRECEQLETPPIEFELYRERASPDAAHALDEMARIVALEPSGHELEVRAHISFGPDAPETELYRGYSLDQRRADWVGEQLIQRGVDPSRFHVAGYGDSTPVADPSTEEGRVANRRIEFWRCVRSPVNDAMLIEPPR